MAESLPTLSRPESEEAKPGTWEADGSPTTGERLHGEWMGLLLSAAAPDLGHEAAPPATAHDLRRGVAPPGHHP